MKNRYRTPHWVIVFTLLGMLMLSGCVTKGRFMAQVSETQSLAEKLEAEQQKTTELEKELALKNAALEKLESEYKTFKKNAEQKEADLRESLAAREKALDIALQSGEKTEGDLRDELRRLRDNYERELERSNQKRLDIETHLEEKKREILNLQNELLAQQEETANLRNTLQGTETDLAKMKRELEESSKAHEDLIDGLKKEITDGSVKITRLKNRLSVEIVDKILFASGSAKITTEGEGVLKKVSAVLKDVKENDIRIEGHTDNVPIGPKLMEKFPSNWELSTARATQVVRFLADQAVPPENMLAAGFSKYRPVADNDNEEGRQRNRRIEIVLFPKDIAGIVEEIKEN